MKRLGNGRGLDLWRMLSSLIGVEYGEPLAAERKVARSGDVAGGVTETNHEDSFKSVLGRC